VLSSTKTRKPKRLRQRKIPLLKRKPPKYRKPKMSKMSMSKRKTLQFRKTILLMRKSMNLR
jgi:hypothetical protein